MPKEKQYNGKNFYFPESLSNVKDRFLDYPIIIVEAPMGYGKTTFVKESLNTVDADILWQKVYDRGLPGFWKSFCRQFGAIDQDLAHSLAALGPPCDSTLRYEALSLFEEMRLQKDTVIVIDDYHMVAGTEINYFIELLIKSEIQYLHLILIARYLELEGMEELKLKGYLLHIKKEAFEFIEKDIKAYFCLYGIILKVVEVKQLYTLTGGWISALYLIAVNYRENGSLNISKDTKRLIEHAVYRNFSEEVKKLLLSLCIFEGFSLEQAVYVSENENAKSLLSEVISKNAFVTYDSGSKIYQIHNIFMNFLKEELENRKLQNELYQRAGQWFLKTGDYNLAQHYFYLCKDFDSIYLTLETERHASINYTYKKDALIRFFLDCPEEIREKRHFAMLILAFELFTYHEMEIFHKARKEFLKNLKKDQGIKEEDRNCLLCDYELLMSFTVYNDIQKMSLHHKRAALLYQKPSYLLPGSGIWTFGSPSILYMFYRESGTLRDAIGLMFEVLPNYSIVTNGNGGGGEYCMKAEGHFYQGEYENALITSHQALCRAKSKKQVTNIICSLFVMMRIALADGNFDTVQELMQTMYEEVTAAKEYLLLYTVEICEGYIYSLLSQPHRIPKWLEKGDYSSDSLLFPNYALLNIIYGRTLLIKREYYKLIGSLDSFLEIASVFPNLLGHIHTYIYVAAANRQIFRQDQALMLLKKALDLAIPDNLYMPFVENCDYIKPLLKELGKENNYSEAAKRIFNLHDTYEKSIIMINKKYFFQSTSKLSKREIEIAGLAVDGLTNKEIGEQLFISANTVKMAIKSIYCKLSINNRLLLKDYMKSLQFK
ncbi:LuxR C-terminal-related transcriptional regulator [Anaerocolumna sp. AGMB13025]|uniref:LuxR C-terminal-related transcriptional regulator n=1 Tax=Anaerocolumna sp. AGMB13025 TaxID=3039116 RepID=UPI00241DA745|nr:LuxR C-terminal-related transcriptional regulator [Anaerocolumna sp. AGMB13025]WFR58987.1 LuxR C-terminal-related transcriptional regulator [Anaerocolumna sp. AGMB13025]